MTYRLSSSIPTWIRTPSRTSKLFQINDPYYEGKHLGKTRALVRIAAQYTDSERRSVPSSGTCVGWTDDEDRDNADTNIPRSFEAGDRNELELFPVHDR